ncbi:MAG: sigma-54 dependent transcriptional regulator [Thermodesulfovibrionia bacterium]|nr:sigma-54 dependent transcriptional regulator [Thermodesulfovibrionia bacterium]
METILIVDDNKDMQFNLSNILKDEGYEVIAVGDGRGALKEVKMRSPNIVLLDIRLPGMDGMKILEEMKKINKDLIEIMITAYGDTKDAVKAMKLGAFDYIAKPFNNEELILTIKKALQSQYLSREVESLRKSLWEKTTKVVGESPQIKHVLKQVKIIAPTNMTVILQGESGTGKELIAQMIYQNSLRKDKPFIAIDCGAIPETLVESELFGYEKGAFTGADAQKEGKFEQANEGTLLLDEITNLPEAAQVKLLRVIQERRLQHLGGKKDIKVDVRIVVATNTNLSEAVRAGKFRVDLFHRLNEFHIALSAIKERKEDIPILAKYFLDEANQELNKKVKGFSARAMKLLLDYHWPGNVRELKNVIKRAVLLTETEDVLPAHLSIDIKPQNEFKLEKHLSNSASFKDIIRKIESELIKNALEEAGGNKSKAARTMYINRKALYRKMKSLGL